MAGKPGFDVRKIYRYFYQQRVGKQQIADRLGLNYTTVRYHLNKISKDEALALLEES